MNQSSGVFYKDHSGLIYGPYSKDELVSLAENGTLTPDLYISNDQCKWYLATNIHGLFANVEQGLAGVGKAETENEQTKRFLDFFVRNEQFLEAATFFQHLKILWTKLTAPPEFVEAQVTAQGTTYTRHNLTNGTSESVDENTVNREIDRGVKSNNFKTAAMTVGLFSTGMGFLSTFYSILKAEPIALFGLFLGIIVVGLSFLGYLHESKREVFVGYVLDDGARRRLQLAHQLLKTLHRCGRIWSFEVHRSLFTSISNSLKYNAGDSFSVSRLPLLVFRRSLPNLQTNIKAPGFTTQGAAVYFLPDKIMVFANSRTYGIHYPEAKVIKDNFVFVEQNGQTYHDSVILDYRWKYINKDGSRDRRFKNNFQLPQVKCGIITLVLGQFSFDLLVSNPYLPSQFFDEYQKLVTCS